MKQRDKLPERTFVETDGGRVIVETRPGHTFDEMDSPEFKARSAEAAAKLIELVTAHDAPGHSITVDLLKRRLQGRKP